MCWEVLWSCHRPMGGGSRDAGAGGSRRAMQRVSSKSRVVTTKSRAALHERDENRISEDRRSNARLALVEILVFERRKPRVSANSATESRAARRELSTRNRTEEIFSPEHRVCALGTEISSARRFISTKTSRFREFGNRVARRATGTRRESNRRKTYLRNIAFARPVQKSASRDAWKSTHFFGKRPQKAVVRAHSVAPSRARYVVPRASTCQCATSLRTERTRSGAVIWTREATILAQSRAKSFERAASRFRLPDREFRYGPVSKGAQHYVIRNNPDRGCDNPQR